VPAKPSTKFTVLWFRCGRSRGYPPTISWRSVYRESAPQAVEAKAAGEHVSERTSGCV